MQRSEMRVRASRIPALGLHDGLQGAGAMGGAAAADQLPAMVSFTVMAADFFTDFDRAD